MRSVSLRTGQTELLNRNILVSLYTAFEVLVADLTHLHYQLHPQAMGAETTIHLRDLTSMASIGDVLEEMRSQKVENLLRGSAEEWIKFFQNECKISLVNVFPDYGQWAECIQRRHLIVHTGGRVSNAYLKRVDWSQVHDPDHVPEIGAILPLTDEYVESALDLFDVAGTLLAASVWRDLCPPENRAKSLDRLYSVIGAVTFTHLMAGRWRVSSQLASWTELQKDIGSIGLYNARFNRWQAQKRLGDVEAVRAEIEAQDTSALALQFLLAREALLEDGDAFFELLPRAVASGQIQIEALRTWPIFLEMRDDSRFEDAVSAAETALPATARLLPPPTDQTKGGQSVDEGGEPDAADAE